MKIRVILLTALISMLCFITVVNAENFKVAIMQLPVAETFKSLVNAIGEATGNTFEIQVVPAGRASFLIEEKLVDIQAPRIKSKDEAFNRELKFDFSTQTIYETAFVLYTNKDKPIDIADLRKGNTKGYKIETDGASVKQFGFTCIASSDPALSLKKVSEGRIDGYIMAQLTGDPALKSLKLTNIRRQLWDHFDNKFTLQKGQNGGKLDGIITAGIKKLKDSGKYEQIMGSIIQKAKYDDWQP